MEKRKGFRQLERLLGIVVAADLAMFALYLVCAGMGIVWLKIISAVVSLAVSGLGIGFLVLIGEHRRARSRWLLAAFVALALCCIVSLICGYPAPALNS